MKTYTVTYQAPITGSLQPETYTCDLSVYFRTLAEDAIHWTSEPRSTYRKQVADHFDTVVSTSAYPVDYKTYTHAAYPHLPHWASDWEW